MECEEFCGLTLPKEGLDRLKIARADALYPTESSDGYWLTPYDPAFERQMTAAESVMQRYRHALHQLAK